MINKDKFDDSYLYSSHKKYDITIDKKNHDFYLYSSHENMILPLIKIKIDDLYLYSSQKIWHYHW